MDCTLEARERPSLGPDVSPGVGPVLVATDGRAPTASAFAIARQLAEHAGVAVEVASVLKPMNALVPALDEPEPPTRAGASRVEQRRARVADLARGVRGANAAWPVTMLRGAVVSSLARLARERGVSLVVTGRVHHGLVERTIGGETPLGLVRAANVPVLAAPATMARLPRIVVVAVGQGTAGIRAADVAHLLLRDAVEIHLVHVRPPAQMLYERERREEDDAYETSIQRAFDAARRAWVLPADVALSTHVVVGRPVSALLNYAADVGADLIVAGLASPAPRLPHRELAVRLFHESSRAMLLVPVKPSPSANAQAAALASRDPAAWPGLLADFTRRNERRVASLAVDEPRLGDRIVARDQRLIAVEYDARGNTIAVMLGAADGSRGHLSHHVPDPLVLAVHRRAGGRDDALVVGHADGQLLLSLE